MLDLLEREIVSLRLRNARIEDSLRKLQSRAGEFASHPKQKTNSRNPKPKRQAATKSARPRPKDNVVQQLALPAVSDSGPNQQDSRPIGKRQALGKSLLQLRRISPVRAPQ